MLTTRWWWGGGGEPSDSHQPHSNMLNHVGFFGGVFQQLRPHSFFFSCWGTPEFNDACNAVWRSMVTNGIDAQRLFLAHQISWMQGDTQTATYIGWHDDSIDIFHKRCLPTPPNFQLHSNFNWESNASVRYDGLGKRRPRKPPIKIHNRCQT